MPRHDTPYEEVCDRPEWWPAKNTIALIEGKYAVLFGQLCKVLGSPRRATRVIFKAVLGPKEKQE